MRASGCGAFLSRSQWPAARASASVKRLPTGRPCAAKKRIMSGNVPCHECVVMLSASNSTLDMHSGGCDKMSRSAERALSGDATPESSTVPGLDGVPAGFE